MHRPFRGSMAAALVAALLMAGCGGNKETAKTPEAGQAAQGQRETTAVSSGLTDTFPSRDISTDTLAVAQKPPQMPTHAAKPKPKEESKTPPPKPEPTMVEKQIPIPAGTTVAVTLSTHLRTDSNQAGDAFTAKAKDAITIEGTTVIPAGAEIRGRLTQVEEPHRTKGRAKMTLQFDSFVDSDGHAHSLETRPIVLEGKGDKISDEAKVLGGGAIGAVVGALASKNKGKGALVGAAAGAAAGGAVALATKGKQLVLDPGHEFTVEVTRTTEIPVMVKAGGGN